MLNEELGVVVNTVRANEGAIEDGRNGGSSSKRPNKSQERFLKEGSIIGLVKAAVVFFKTSCLNRCLCGPFVPGSGAIRVVWGNYQGETAMNFQAAKGCLRPAVVKARLLLPLDTENLSGDRGIALGGPRSGQVSLPRVACGV